MKKSLIAVTVVLAMAASPAWARGKHRNKGAHTAKATSDNTWVMNVAKDGMAEVELAKLAQGKASSDQVKQFAQRMMTDHQKANDELKSLAQSKNITLPSAVPARDKALHDRLSRLSGDAFDRAYMNAMVTDHRKAVNAFRMESQSGKDPDIKNWASKTLPTLEEHLKQAQDANRAVGTSGKK